MIIVFFPIYWIAILLLFGGGYLNYYVFQKETLYLFLFFIGIMFIITGEILYLLKCPAKSSSKTFRLLSAIVCCIMSLMNYFIWEENSAQTQLFTYFLIGAIFWAISVGIEITYSIFSKKLVAYCHLFSYVYLV